MKLKPSLKNSANPALPFSFIISVSISLFLYGCLGPVEPAYKEKDTPYMVKKICKDEYNLDVTTKRTYTTLWIYAPLTKFLHKEYGKKEDKIFDEEMLDNLRNILTTIGRVVINSDNPPEFFALLASDINLGLDYTIIGNALDIKKSYAGFIPWIEANRRYVIGFKLAPEAIQDTTGTHLDAYDIKLPDFLAEQISQRIGVQFREEGWKKYFEVDESNGRFSNGTFIFEYSIKQTSRPPKEINLQEEILNTIAYCIKTYEFKDFTTLELKDLLTQHELILSQAAIWERQIH